MATLTDVAPMTWINYLAMKSNTLFYMEEIKILN